MKDAVVRTSCISNHKPLIITGLSSSVNLDQNKPQNRIQNQKNNIPDIPKSTNHKKNSNSRTHLETKSSTIKSIVISDKRNDKSKDINSRKRTKKILTVGTPKNKEDSRKTWWIMDGKEISLPIIAMTESQKWFDLIPNNDIDEFLITSRQSDSKLEVVSDTGISREKLMDIIESLYTEEVARYKKYKSTLLASKSDEKWINDVIKSGTLSDKVAALALRVQESPIHHIESLDILINMASKKEQRTSQLSLEALKDLLINSLLPDRKLNFISSYDLLTNPKMNVKTALLLYFEDNLKKRVERVIDALEAGQKSSVDFFKRICLSMTSDLLTQKPEQEARLLFLLVNKLGDPSSNICSKAIELLKQVISTHAAMKTVVVREVRQFIYKPNIKLKFVFNGIIFLCQIPLGKGEHAGLSNLSSLIIIIIYLFI